MIRNALSIAGFDPSAGAGVIMDMKVFSAIGVHAYAVPTAIVEENSDTVSRVTGVAPDVVIGLLGTLLDHSRVAGTKIGMVYSGRTARAVKHIIRQYGLDNVVLDPVTLSSSGTRLFADKVDDGITTLLPFCTVVTPNLAEASALSGIRIRDRDDMLSSAQYFIDRGAAAVVIKGGHFAQRGLDLYMDGKRHAFLEAKAVDRDVHGTGCMLSSAITAYLIKGYGTFEAVKKAKAFTLRAIKNSYRLSPSLKRYVGMPGIVKKKD